MKDRNLVINILTNNRVSELCLCLTSLINQDYQEWDLVIIDDGSTVPCTNYKFFNDLIGRLKILHQVKLVRHEVTTLNIGKNRNECVEFSKKLKHNTTKYILRIDDDSVCEYDYVRRLYEAIINDPKIGAVGGVVPLLEGPNYYRKTPRIFNETIFNSEGDLLSMSDDGGVDYNDERLILSHHLRSSFIFRTKAHDSIGGHPLEYGNTGFREETDFSLRLRLAGYLLFTDVQAKCYHQKARSGGARMPPEHYNQQVRLNDEHFRIKMRMLIMKNKKNKGVII